MTPIIRVCSDCESSSDVSRREFLRSAGAAAVAVGAAPLVARGADAIAPGSTPETVTKLLYESLNDAQQQGNLFRLGLCRGRRRQARSAADPDLE